jgi:hypothetical protein
MAIPCTLDVSVVSKRAVAKPIPCGLPAPVMSATFSEEFIYLDFTGLDSTDRPERHQNAS